MPATSIPAAPIDFGPVDCGASGGTQAVAFTNTGTASLHYRATVSAGGPFSLKGGTSDGSVSGDVAPGAQANVTVVAGVVPTTSAAGAVIMGTLSVTTNATGAESTQIAVSVTAQGGACTLNCGSFAKCSPTNASPYCANTQTDNANCGACGHACGSGEVCDAGVCTLACGALSTCTPDERAHRIAPTSRPTTPTAAPAATRARPARSAAPARARSPAAGCRPAARATPRPIARTCRPTAPTAAPAATSAPPGSHACRAPARPPARPARSVRRHLHEHRIRPEQLRRLRTTCAFPQGSAACLGGNCVLAVAAPDTWTATTTHDGCEVNKSTNAANCGACGAACALGETCNARRLHGEPVSRAARLLEHG